MNRSEDWLGLRDTLVYSESEFGRLRADPSSLVTQEFPFMAEL